MSVSLQREGRGCRPGLRLAREPERGSVTIETAGALAVLFIVFAMVVQLLGVVHARLSLQSVAREAARISAIQVDEATALGAANDFVHRVSPDIRLSLTSDGPYVVADVLRIVRAPLWPTGITLTANATALREAL